MIRVFSDLHHADLYYSLQLLFEKRIGAELYRPIGLEWYSENYWNIYPHIDTARQFLGLDQAINLPKDTYGEILPPSARINQQYTFEDGIYYVTDVTKGKVNRGITLEKFKEMKFDIIISSIPEHIGPFNDLITKYQKQAKHIFQVGNTWKVYPGVKNILASTAPFPVPSGVKVCFYHQEFDLDVFNYEPPNPTNQKSIFSYIHYMRNPGLFNEYATSLPNFYFRSFGAGMEDGIAATQKLADTMRSSTFTWHYKPEGDGMGHVIHNTFAVGRSPLVWGSHYKGKLAEALFQDGVTCIDMEKRLTANNLKIIQSLSQPQEHQRMCEAASLRFRQVVNFDEEESKIRKFLTQLL